MLTRNPDAVQIGLTATPREFESAENTEEAEQDRQITANNIKYFGEPVYDYTIGQGIDDGYLAFMEILKSDIFLATYKETEQVTGLEQADLEDKPLVDAVTGEAVGITETRERYDARAFERQLLIPDRVSEMCRMLFEELLKTGGPEQKTVIFCARDVHADAVASEMNNLYAKWCADQGRTPARDYAFKCTAASGGSGYLSDFRGSNTSYFIATTVELLTTGVDVPGIRNVVFFKYVGSPIAFYQMVGRGTRLDPPTNKLMFRVHDFTNATRLFGEDFKTAYGPSTSSPGPVDGPDEDGDRIIVVEDIDVRITAAGKYVMTVNDDGKAEPVTLEEYKQRLAARLVEDIPALDKFRSVWIDPGERGKLMRKLPDRGRAPLVVRELSKMKEYDLFDVLADVGYGQAPKTRADRADSFEYKHDGWLSDMPAPAAAVIRAIASQFAIGGTENLENPQVFSTPAVRTAGGMGALREHGQPRDVVSEAERRMFAA